MDVRVIQGDIAQQSADALVDAAGTSLRTGSGVAGALRRVGGEAPDRADDLGCEALVMPALGCGVAGSALVESEQVIAEEIDGVAPESLSELRFIAHGDRGYETGSRVADDVRDGGE